MIPLPTLRRYRRFIEWVVHLRGCLVVAEGREADREEFAPLMPREAPRRGVKWGLSHVLNNPWYEYLVFALVVLFVQNAVAFVVHVCTAKAVLATLEVPAVA